MSDTFRSAGMVDDATSPVGPQTSVANVVQTWYARAGSRNVNGTEGPAYGHRGSGNGIHDLEVTHSPQPHAEQQADEGEDCQGLAEHRS